MMVEVGHVCHKQNKFLKLSSLASSLLVVMLSTACSETTRSASLAPRPPMSYPVLIQNSQDPVHNADALSAIETASGFSAQRTSGAALPVRDAQPKGCRIQDRFDRRYALAYQWGQNGRNQVGMDVDGVGFDRVGFDGLKIEYTLHFQAPEKKKRRCRYQSSWQGLVGTSYNEVFKREHDTVWGDLRRLEDDVEARFETLIGR